MVSHRKSKYVSNIFNQEMRDDPSRSELSATTIALRNHDILCHLFEGDKRIIYRTSGLSDDDLLRCALVCRAFCEPALRALWADMSLPTPLWQLLAPTINDSVRRNSSPRSFDAVSSSTQTAFGVNTSRIELLDLPSDNV